MECLLTFKKPIRAIEIRIQFVSINDYSSDLHFIRSGVL